MEQARITKKELIERIAAKNDLAKSVAANIANDFLNAIVEEVAAEKRIEFNGFGFFTVADIAEREGRNPRTGEKIIIAAHKKIVFKPSKTFKNKVN